MLDELRAPKNEGAIYEKVTHSVGQKMLSLASMFFGVDFIFLVLYFDFAKIFCASHKNVSSVLRLADCTLEKQLRKIGSRSSFSGL